MATVTRKRTGNQPTAEDVFTTGQVAKLCKVAPRTIAKWFDSGRLGSGVRVGTGSQGGQRRVTREELVRFMRERNFPIPDDLLPPSTVLVLTFDERLISAVQRLGYLTTSVRTGFDVGWLLNTLKPWLVVLDLATGRSEALVMARRLRAIRPDVRLAAVACEDEVERLREFDVVVKRPFDAAALAGKLAVAGQ